MYECAICGSYSRFHDCPGAPQTEDVRSATVFRLMLAATEDDQPVPYVRIDGTGWTRWMTNWRWTDSDEIVTAEVNPDAAGSDGNGTES